jgi:YVTN family beta-propeller protein
MRIAMKFINLFKSIAIIFTFFLIFSFSVIAQPKPVLNKNTGGKILLPNGWILSPAGKHADLGDLPMGMAVNPQETYAVVTNNGFSKPFLSVVDLKKKKVVQTLSIKNSWLGIKFFNEGKTLAVSGGNENKIYFYDFDKGNLTLSDSIVLGKSYPKDKISIAGIDIDKNNNTLICVTKENNSFYAIDIKSKTLIKKIDLKDEGYTCMFSKKNPYIFASIWGGKKVLIIDKSNYEILKQIEVENHPNDLFEDPEGKRLFVTNGNENTVSVIDIHNMKVIETLACSLYPNSPCGSTPNSVTTSTDGKMLYVANADNNFLAIFDISEFGESKPVGFIPVGWYPTMVRCTKDGLLVLNGKGHSGSKANPEGPQPIGKRTSKTEYIGGLFWGSISFIDYPNKANLKKYTKQVFENTQYKDKPDYKISGPNPIPIKKGDKSPIKYVFYVIKENRTYDQVFGDIKKGNGDASLCLFPDSVTPNQHKLVNEFVLFDNFYVNAEVSADGHNWSMGAYATDFVEKTWPTNYGGRGGEYDFEGSRAIASPTNGYIWDYCHKYKVSYRSYGEFADNGKTHSDSSKAMVKNLIGHVAPFYFGWDLKYKDAERVKDWMKEFDEYEKNGGLPQLQIIRLPNNHTAGTSKGMHTPIAMVADNDLAVGALVERISKSKFWKESAIFILEDDAQNGPDHVDAHRSPVLVISPYIKKGTVDSRMYSTASALRTIELILGLPPMSQYDGGALPFYNSFTMNPDLKPYEKVIPNIDMDEINHAGAYGQERCAEFDFTDLDKVPDIEFSEIIWKSIKGKDSPVPSPKRSVFVKF